MFDAQLEPGRHVVVVKNLEDKKALGVDQVRQLNAQMSFQ